MLTFIGCKSSAEADTVKKFIPTDPNAVYIYASLDNKYIVIQNNGIQDDCLNRFTIGLSSESPSTDLLSKKDVDEFIHNRNSKKFIKHSSMICFKDRKIYNDFMEFYNEKMHWVSGATYPLKCTAEAKKTEVIFGKERTIIHSHCTDKNGRYYDFYFSEGIGLYKSTGSVLKAIKSYNNVTNIETPQKPKAIMSHYEVID